MEDKEYYLTVGGKRVKVSGEVYKEFRRAEDKERYFMRTLKMGHTVANPETREEEYRRSRELSYERLLEEDWQFEAPEGSAEMAAVKSLLVGELRAALYSLTEEEMALIKELFFLERTEREAAGIFGVSQRTIHYRKEKVLDKLRDLLENI